MTRRFQARGGLDRSVTLTVELADGAPYTFVAYNQEHAVTRLAAMPELPRRLLSLSTPDTIFNDLCGEPSRPVIRPRLMACFQEPPLPRSTSESEWVRGRLYEAQREIAEMRGEISA